MEPIDPAEQARHLKTMHDLGMYAATWALAQRVAQGDDDRAQSRLLLPVQGVLGGPILELFPELGELGPDGDNAQRRIPVTILSADGVEEKAVRIHYIPTIGGYRIVGSGWRQFLMATGIRRGNRLDVYTCSRGDGERCLFFFKSELGAGGSHP